MLFLVGGATQTVLNLQCYLYFRYQICFNYNDLRNVSVLSDHLLIKYIQKTETYIYRINIDNFFLYSFINYTTNLTIIT